MGIFDVHQSYRYRITPKATKFDLIQQKREAYRQSLIDRESERIAKIAELETFHIPEFHTVEAPQSAPNHDPTADMLATPEATFRIPAAAVAEIQQPMPVERKNALRRMTTVYEGKIALWGSNVRVVPPMRLAPAPVTVRPQ